METNTCVVRTPPPQKKQGTHVVCRMTSLQWLKSQHDIACKDWKFSR